ncbi:DUF2156 domain-containing protein [bacterium]|nr:MAG: DUF2156 domain-containing protein [bacterium]
MAEITSFPDFCEVSLDYREQVAGVLGKMNRPISEMTFSNLYLFRDTHGYRLSRRGDFLFALGRGYDSVPYAFPPWGEGNYEEAVAALLGYLRETGRPRILFPVPKEMAERHFSGPQWKVRSDRDEADYVYLREDLASLSGPRYHKRKNRLEKFLREEGAGLEYAEFSDEYVPECVDIAKSWCDEYCPAKRPSAAQETEAAVEALRHRAELGLTGAVIKREGKVLAYCLGEPLNEETFVVQFEKTAPSQAGLAQVLNRDFSRNSLSGYEYVNREQDLGDTGLRQAKESYHPVFLAEKYVVSPAGEP